MMTRGRGGSGYPPKMMTSFMNSPLSSLSQVDLLVERRSLYATFGKVHGRFLDGQADK